MGNMLCGVQRRNAGQAPAYWQVWEGQVEMKCFFVEDDTVIVPLTVQEILDEQVAMKLV